MKYIVAFLYLLGLSSAQNNFVGRSGQVSVEPLKTSTSRMVLLDEMDGITLSDIQYPIDDINVANLVSHLVGIAPLNNLGDREGFPAGSIFRKAKANMMFSMDAPSLSCPEMGQGYVIRTKAVDSINFLSNIATGATPLDHGIVGRSWIDHNGRSVTAYSEAGSSFRPNLADLMSSSFAGRSLSLTFSNDNTRANVFASSSQNSQNVVLSSKTLPPSVSDHALALDGFVETSDSFSFKGVTFAKSNAAKAFLAEVSAIQGLVLDLKNRPSLTGDEIPDCFYFAVSTISALPTELQHSASELAVAVAKNAYAALQQFYDGRVVAELIQEVRPLAIPADLVSAFKRELGTSTKTDLLPQIYVSKLPSKTVCNKLDSIAYTMDLKVNCNSQLLFRSHGNGTTTQAQAEDAASAFTIFVWITIFVFLMALGAIYMLCGVGFDMYADSMLFEQFRKHAKRD